MDLVSPIVDVVGRVWDCTAKHRNYLRGLEENLDNLRTEMDRLKDARNDIKIRVDAEEAAQMMIRTHVVDGWLNSVEAMEPQVDSLRDLKSKGAFDVVTQKALPAVVKALPAENSIVGMDSTFERVWTLLGKDEVGILGLYGMGGVGKTTLLRKINNEFLKTSSVFDFVDFADAFNRGHSIIGFLQATCLLESGVDEDTQVKMHDVIRDMALWIACECGSEKNRVLVKANKASDEPPKADKWIKAQWISMMHTSITQLIVVPDCPRLSTLLLFNNSHLKKIHPNFFQSMPLLKFLDLSSTSISYLPPSIGDLARLEFLDLSDTKIKELPSEIMKLENLKYLSFKMTEKLHQIQPGVIAHLSNLQMLKLRDHNFGDGDEALQASVQELACLKQMNALEILISNVKFLESFLSYPRLVLCTRSLSIESCKGLISLALSSLEYMKRLQKFVIGDCSELKELIIDCSTKTAGVELFRSLEIMVFSALPRLDISWDINIPHAACFKNLHTLFLDQCDMLVNLTWLFLTPNIRVLHVKRCLRIEEIISDEFGAFGASLFSKLATLVLDDLPCLWSICRSPLPFLSLKLIVVLNCPKLRRLPFDSNSAKDKLEKITGRSEWWENLEWDNETIEREFAPYLSKYIPYMFRVYVPQMYLDEENQNACCIS
ncbi:hypothetical protein IFM89_028819 [Coptis chinensis]|uniref:NB-ARC domain-containing protein n=1 Tax=Coptis chinensis TaxID=261450 RepID=A0A835H9F7_9MAGN|nr:hypothetical protein IFM89_028819 [Coptis chinensis]